MVMRAARRSLLADWDYVDNQEAFKERVAQRVAKHLAREEVGGGDGSRGRRRQSSSV